MKDSGLVTNTSWCDSFRAEEACRRVPGRTLARAPCSLARPCVPGHRTHSASSPVCINWEHHTCFRADYSRISTCVTGRHFYNCKPSSKGPLTRTKGSVFSMGRRYRYCCPEMPLIKIWIALSFIIFKIITKGGGESNNIFCNIKHNTVFHLKRRLLVKI